MNYSEKIATTIVNNSHAIFLIYAREMQKFVQL